LQPANPVDVNQSSVLKVAEVNQVANVVERVEIAPADVAFHHHGETHQGWVIHGVTTCYFHLF
jgi:hypothetical protein